MARGLEGYNTGKVNAEMLRDIANDIENRGDYQNIHVQIWYKTPTEVHRGLRTKARTMAKNHGRAVDIEFPDGTKETVEP